MKFDPECYTISIRKETHDGEIFYVGRVDEFPNISSFEDSFDEARAMVIDAIQTLKKIAEETSEYFPDPYTARFDEFSGRVTLRLPKSLHAKVSTKASQEEVSVNQYLVTAIATYVGEADGIAKVMFEASTRLSNIFSHAITHMFSTIPSMANDKFLQCNFYNVQYLETTPSSKCKIQILEPRHLIGAS